MRGLTTLAQPVSIELDLRDIPNPGFIEQLTQETVRLLPGDTIDAITNDPCAEADLVAWLAAGDMELLRADARDASSTCYHLRKREAA